MSAQKIVSPAPKDRAASQRLHCFDLKTNASQAYPIRTDVSALRCPSCLQRYKYRQTKGRNKTVEAVEQVGVRARPNLTPFGYSGEHPENGSRGNESPHGRTDRDPQDEWRPTGMRYKLPDSVVYGLLLHMDSFFFEAKAFEEALRKFFLNVAKSLLNYSPKVAEKTYEEIADSIWGGE
jgi:hypothetical protein